MHHTDVGAGVRARHVASPRVAGGCELQLPISALRMQRRTASEREGQPQRTEWPPLAHSLAEFGCRCLVTRMS
jgi:hypothetical protein